MVGIEGGSVVGAGLFALLDLGSGPNSPIAPGPIIFSGPSISSASRRPRPRPRPQQGDDVPFWFPDYTKLTSITNIDRLIDWIDEGDGQWEKLARTLLATPGIAALGIFSHLENAVRSPGPGAGTTVARPRWRK